MGKERANAMMSLLPPVGWADVATKRDLDALEERLDAKLNAVNERFDAVNQRFDAVNQRFDTVATKAELHELRADLQRTFVTWMFASQAAVIAAMGVLLGLFR